MCVVHEKSDVKPSEVHPQTAQTLSGEMRVVACRAAGTSQSSMLVADAQGRLTKMSRSSEGFLFPLTTDAPLGSGSRKGLLDILFSVGNGNCRFAACSLAGEGELAPAARWRKGLLEPKVRLEGEGCRSTGSMGGGVSWGWWMFVLGGGGCGQRGRRLCATRG